MEMDETSGGRRSWRTSSLQLKPLGPACRVELWIFSEKTCVLASVLDGGWKATKVTHTQRGSRKCQANLPSPAPGRSLKIPFLGIRKKKPP